MNFGPLIIPVNEDLARFRRASAFNKAQDAGSMAVICSPPGQGKTTSVYAAASLIHTHFNPVLSVPPLASLPLRDIPKWLQDNLPVQSAKATLVLIDGREKTDDEQGLNDVMSSVNNAVRGRPDLQFVWPTTDTNWRDRLVAAARKFGGQSFCPDQSVFAVKGPAKSQWLEAVELVMDQIGSNWDEFGINRQSAEVLLEQYSTLGDFLTAINSIRVDQEAIIESAAGLPEVVFVVSSHSKVVGDVARLRNPNTYKLRTDEIIHSARSSAAGKFWISRGAKQQGNLAWVSSLFQAKLVSLTPSTVAHAVGAFAPEGSRLKTAIAPTGFRAQRSTGNIAYRTTDLGRFLRGESVPEVLSKNKGKTSATAVAAYDAIQALSAKQHRYINEATLALAADSDGVFDYSQVQFEVPLGGDAVSDAIVPALGRRLHLEFHHLSGKHCSPNKISSYIMSKLAVYAIQYNLIER